MDLLFSFQPDAPEQSLFELSRRLRFPPSTARRLPKVIMARRLVQQDPLTKLYRLGPGIFYLASVAKDGLDIRKIALPVMERLRDVTGENISLHELRDGKRVCVEKAESKQVLRDYDSYRRSISLALWGLGKSIARSCLAGGAKSMS